MKLQMKILIAALLLLAAPIRAGILVDYEPTRVGGPAADTDFINNSGYETWQLLANRISFNSPATVRQISWWGFYGGDFSPPENPPTNESMRVRFYGTRADGVPDQSNIISEQVLANPSRTATGFPDSSNGSNEYLYQAALPAAVNLDASTTYWFEVVQLDDVNSHFRWETSYAQQGASYAYDNDLGSDWRISSGGNLAFQLSTIPEPAAGCLLVGGLLPVILRRGRVAGGDQRLGRSV